ncbi:MAG: 4Fe-4S dicluster domain-containing protein [bacterium]|nr:4Fe-4S dicluster domain-containing protein [bacterium]
MPNVVIDKERCKGCRLCISVCSRKALNISKMQNSKGFFPAEVACPEKCTSCTFCGLVCPDIAIQIYK